MVRIVYSDKFSDSEIKSLNIKLKLIIDKIPELNKISFYLNREGRSFLFGKDNGPLYIDKISKKVSNIKEADANPIRQILNLSPYASYYTIGHELTHFFITDELETDIFILSKGLLFVDDLPVYLCFNILSFHNIIKKMGFETKLSLNQLTDRIEKLFKLEQDNNKVFRKIVVKECKNFVKSKSNEKGLILTSNLYDYITNQKVSNKIKSLSHSDKQNILNHLKNEQRKLKNI